MFEESEIDPGFEEVAERDEAAVQHDVLATVGRRRALGLPDWDGGTQSTNSPAQNKAADDELGKLEASALQNLANEGQESSAEDEFAAAENVADPRTGQSTKEGTDGEGGNDSTLLG